MKDVGGVRVYVCFSVFLLWLEFFLRFYLIVFFDKLMVTVDISCPGSIRVRAVSHDICVFQSFFFFWLRKRCAWDGVFTI